MDLSVGCDHPVRVAGMCAICGIALDDDSHDSQGSSAQLHDIAGVQINSAEAERIDSESTEYLLSNRKLALIVDLDQTILHATVDPTVGEWKNDPRNPNYGALLSVGKFRLRTDGSAIKEDSLVKEGNAESTVKETSTKDSKQLEEDEGCWYYVKQRPGLEHFLADLSTRFEMHVYTMGTRSYAESVCRLVDPKGMIFGARILSRDENGSIIQKSLKKLFPVDTSMVVIIDDRADVWNWSPNLVKVMPYDFFVGIGDINASFLPAASTITAPAQEEVQKENGTGSISIEEGRVKTGEEIAADDAKSDDDEARRKLEEATAVAESSQKAAVSEQIGSRPLAKMQEALDVKNDSTKERVKVDQAVLQDNDTELDRLQSILDQIHLQWYQRWDRMKSDKDKPATTDIIASIKHRVLSSCVIVFSSVFPLQQRPESSDLWQLASEFGASCKTEIDDTVTHLVAGKADTHKVFLAHQMQGIAVVWPDWLRTSCAAWYRQPEEAYALPERSLPILSSSEAGQISSESDQLLTSFDSSLAEGKDEDDEDEDQGFGEMNWNEANDEVDAALDGLTDEDDTEDEGYTTDGSIKRKRIRSGRSSVAADDEETANLDDEEEDNTLEANLSPLSKRRKLAELRSGQSKLKHAVPVRSSSSSSSVAAVAEHGNHSRPHSEVGNDGDSDDDFLKSLQDELELQLAGRGGEEDDQQQEEGLASDDE